MAGHYCILQHIRGHPRSEACCHFQTEREDLLRLRCSFRLPYHFLVLMDIRCRWSPRSVREEELEVFSTQIVIDSACLECCGFFNRPRSLIVDSNSEGVGI